MYFVLYDRNLKSIGETYLLESWSRVQRAVDFDDMKIVGEQIPYYTEPFFVVIKDKQGKPMFSGLASTPVIDEKKKKTTISMKDYATLFNSEIIVDWSAFSGKTVAEYLNMVLQCWKDQSPCGFENVSWDTTQIEEILLDSDIPLGTEKENVSVKELVFDVLNLYLIHYKAEIDLHKKELKFSFYKINQMVSIRLSDFDVNAVEKSFGEYNRAKVYSADFSLVSEWTLTEDNEVRKISKDNEDITPVYPAKWKNFVAKDIGSNAIYDATYDAVMGLAGNRYQEDIELNVAQHKSILDLSNIGFDVEVEAYDSKGLYRKLPVGEIETNSNGLHLIRLGHRIQELTQEI